MWGVSTKKIIILAINKCSARDTTYKIKSSTTITTEKRKRHISAILAIKWVHLSQIHL